MAQLAQQQAEALPSAQAFGVVVLCTDGSFCIWNLLLPAEGQQWERGDGGK